MKHKIRTHVNNVGIYTTTFTPPKPAHPPVCAKFSLLHYLGCRLLHHLLAHTSGMLQRER